jgi:hypothetical protein
MCPWLSGVHWRGCAIPAAALVLHIHQQSPLANLQDPTRSDFKILYNKPRGVFSEGYTRADGKQEGS